MLFNFLLKLGHLSREKCDRLCRVEENAHHISHFSLTSVNFRSIDLSSRVSRDKYTILRYIETVVIGLAGNVEKYFFALLLNANGVLIHWENYQITAWKNVDGLWKTKFDQNFGFYPVKVVFQQT